MERLALRLLALRGDEVADDRVRESERQWRMCGSAENEAAYLAELLRTRGPPIHSTLELAAFCGYEPAARALGEPTLAPPPPAEVFLTGLRNRDPRVSVVAAVGLLRCALARHPNQLAEQLLRLAEGWLTLRTQDIEEGLGDLTDDANEAMLATEAEDERQILSCASFLGSAIHRFKYGDEAEEYQSGVDALHSLEALLMSSGGSLDRVSLLSAARSAVIEECKRGLLLS